MHVITNDPLVLPVTASEFATVAKLDDSDPAITSALYVATSAAIAFLKLDLIARQYVLTHEDCPKVNVNGRCTYVADIELPFANLITVDEVLVCGSDYTDYRILAGRPNELRFESLAYLPIDETAIKITYTAGYGTTSADVPEVIKQAIIAMAMYVYSHAGSCDSSQALEMSGAKAMLMPYAVRGGIII